MAQGRETPTLVGCCPSPAGRGDGIPPAVLLGCSLSPPGSQDSAGGVLPPSEVLLLLTHTSGPAEPHGEPSLQVFSACLSAVSSGQLVGLGYQNDTLSVPVTLPEH